MVNAKAGLEGYALGQLVRAALDRKNASEAVPFIGEVLSVRKYLANGGEVVEGEREDGLLVRAALERELLAAAGELLEKRVGRLGSENEELFELGKLKVPKRDSDLLFRFVELYLETTRCSPRRTNAYGQSFVERLQVKEQRERVEAIVQDYEQRYPAARKEPAARRS